MTSTPKSWDFNTPTRYERTSVPNVYATGEVTLYGGMIYGLVVLGYDMEDFGDHTERLCQTSRSYEIKEKKKPNSRNDGCCSIGKVKSCTNVGSG
ncbi:8078_t:CDS:2 [Funneliformis mosseae]|uniref:8078_t:CDS:1 n=1 Tax=Funneliformis mosseae TaxID=27381 RepID=A0A9N9BD35_FUNMO|nr:8078_t:CDS:2 [Funneliformis mosseae]